MTCKDRLIDLCRQANAQLKLRVGCVTWGDFADYLIADGVTIAKWIPVTERLPEFGKRVLILGNRKDGQFIYIDQVCADGNWLLVNWGVTHWMPLPEPPKGE